jgi:hypothetical protein
MAKEKLYFRSYDHTTCYYLDWHLDDARDEGLEKITLVEAIPDNDTKDYVWCTQYENVEEKSLCCKINCPAYTSKSGKGKCQYRGNLYNHGNEVTFEVLK